MDEHVYHVPGQTTDLTYALHALYHSPSFVDVFNRCSEYDMLLVSLHQAQQQRNYPPSPLPLAIHKNKITLRAMVTVIPGAIFTGGEPSLL